MTPEGIIRWGDLWLTRTGERIAARCGRRAYLLACLPFLTLLVPIICLLLVLELYREWLEEFRAARRA